MTSANRQRRQEKQEFPDFVKALSALEKKMERDVGRAARCTRDNAQFDPMGRNRSAVERAIFEVNNASGPGSSVSAKSRLGDVGVRNLGDISGIVNLNSGKFANSNGVVDKLLEEQKRSIKAVGLRDSLNDYYKSLDHVRDIFDTHKILNKMGKLGIGIPKTNEIERHLVEMSKPISSLSETRELPSLPKSLPNPIHQTNEHLAELGEKIDALVSLQAKQAEVIDMLLQAQVANEVVQERTSKHSLRLGIINTTLATILGIVAIIVTVIVAG